MAASKLDQIVKGAPPPDATLPHIAITSSAPLATIERPTSSHGSTASTRNLPAQTSDPTALLPSAPPQIYLNLLILEASLRQQYLILRARRRQHTFVLILLLMWIAYFTYGQFLRPREDGTGVGGSVYWLVDTGEKVALISGYVMAALFWVTGQWERGLRWPRRWLGITNRGLRSMNVKIVLTGTPLWKELLSPLSALFPLSTIFPAPTSSYHFIDYTTAERRALAAQSRPRASSSVSSSPVFAEEDIAPGGDTLRLILLPKHFTPDFREDWDSYRAAYWDAENARRSELRSRIRASQRALARHEGGWAWWAGWRGWARIAGLTPLRPRDLAKLPQGQHAHAHSQSHSHSTSHSTLHPAPSKHRRRPSTLRDEREGHSRSSSRSSTSPTPESEERERRWSTGTAGSGSAAAGRRRIGSGRTASGRLAPAGSRPGTPSSLGQEAVAADEGR